MSKLLKILIVGIICIGILYAVKRSTDIFESVDLLPQQQQVPGYKQRTVDMFGKEVNIYLPKGYQLDTVNTKLFGPRLIHVHGDQLFVGSTKGGVYRLDPPYDKPQEIMRLRRYPNSVLVHKDMIYVAMTNGIYRAPYSDEVKWIDGETELELVVPLWDAISHSSRTIKAGPDGRIYISGGSTGNCKDFYVHESYPSDRRRGGVFVLDESGTEPKLTPYAGGLRNPVGFDWHPDTGVMYATNNGPDHSGYDQPPEYFSKVTEGSFHGMPWYQFDGEKMTVDECADFPAPHPIEEAQPPVLTFPAHNAPLDFTFVTENANASEFHGDAIVALHGSWATSSGKAKGDPASKRHPKLVRVRFENGEAIEVIDLLTGFQDAEGERWARPASVAIGPDGDIYFTSDQEINGLFRLRKSDSD